MSRPEPVISIVIPAYNAAEFLASTLDSVLAQTELRWELVVVDDGSTDGTFQLAEDYAARDTRIRVITQANTGQAAARNQGFAITSPGAPFVIFLDHDDVWEPNALSHLLRALSSAPGAVAAHGIGRFIDRAGKAIRPCELESKVLRRIALVDGCVKEWPTDQPTTFAVLIWDCCLVSPGLVLIRRSALEQVGLLDTMASLGFSSLDDWDLWLRLSRLGDLAVVNQVVLNYRLHSGNLSRHQREMCLGSWHVLRKTAHSSGLNQDQRRMARYQYMVFVKEARREMATHLRQVVFEKFREARKNFLRGQLSEAWRGWRFACPRFFSYLMIRQFATPGGVWAYTCLEDDLLPKRMRRTTEE